LLEEIMGGIATASDDRSARGIAAALGRMISAGIVPDGARLPTVRELAKRLEVSPTTVSDAWRSLANVGAIEARGRNGSFARRPTGPGRPRRYRQISGGPGHFQVDLSTGTPDPTLLPDLGPIVARVSKQNLTSSYLDHPVLPDLEELLVDSWPFPPEAITVVDGAMDALDRIAQEVLHLGDRVVVEHPTFPPMLDLLELLGCEVIGVDVDDEGIEPAGVEAALARGPRMLLLQPRAQNPTGVALSPRRAQKLAKLLRNTTTIVVEDDHANNISAAPIVTVGRWLPERTVHVRSYSKSHGPDLRLAAVGGSGDIVTAVANRRLLGPGWSSRILQAVLVELLRDPATADTLARAREVYGTRRAAISAALGSHDVEHRDGDGINLWMRVDDERTALMWLVAVGLGAAPGHPFLVRPDHDHLRITVSAVGDDDAAQIGEHLATAAIRRPHSARAR